MTAALFIALVLLVAFMASRALHRANTPTWVIVLLGFVYLVIPAVLASLRMLDRYTPLPPPAIVMILAVTIATLAITLSSVGANLIAAIGLPVLVGFQAFRIPVEWLLHRLYLEGMIPVQMTYAGRNFDIVSGMTAAVLGAWLTWGRPPKWVVLAWNVLGIALLANIVTIAVISTPVPFRRFVEAPPHILPSLFPYVWLPTFLVQMALAGHVLVFRRLFSEK